MVSMLLDKNLLKVKNYSNASQQVRILTEDWVSVRAFCPICGSGFTHYPNNKPVADFFCDNCKEDFELKSKQGNIGIKINDGAYSTMVERLNSDKNPNFLLLSYDRDLFVKNFFAIPKYFFTLDVVEKRKPLSESARRHGWIGCNIVLSGIPESGKIFYIKNGVAEKKDKILEEWQETTFLMGSDIKNERGWLVDVMLCLDKIPGETFDLQKIYTFEKFLSVKHPNNKHIRDKIRQQLQVLRDNGKLDFVSRGIYKKR